MERSIWVPVPSNAKFARFDVASLLKTFRSHFGIAKINHIWCGDEWKCTSIVSLMSPAGASSSCVSLSATVCCGPLSATMYGSCVWILHQHNDFSCPARFYICLPAGCGIRTARLHIKEAQDSMHGLLISRMSRLFFLKLPAFSVCRWRDKPIRDRAWGNLRQIPLTRCQAFAWGIGPRSEFHFFTYPCPILGFRAIVWLKSTNRIRPYKPYSLSLDSFGIPTAIIRRTTRSVWWDSMAPKPIARWLRWEGWFYVQPCCG